MSIILIGGMDRLKGNYKNVSKRYGHNLKCLCANEKNFKEKIGNPDILLIFTNKISYEAKDKAFLIAKKRGIAIKLFHSCGVSALKEYLSTNQD